MLAINTYNQYYMTYFHVYSLKFKDVKSLITYGGRKLTIAYTSIPGSPCLLTVFPRCKTSEQKMEVIYANPTTTPYDLFATSRRSTCGKRAGTTTGNGTYANPYVINVDLSNGLSSQSPDCGVVVRQCWSLTSSTTDRNNFLLGNGI